jgi:hypothetical protein
VLWQYVQQKSGDYTPQISLLEIRATVAATARQEERCLLTGKLIQPNEPMLLGLTLTGGMVPLSTSSLA